MDPLILQTERLVLRAFELEDSDTLYVIANQFVIADTTISVPHPYTLEYAKDWIHQSHQAFAERTSVHFAMVEQETYRLIGYIGLKDLDHEHQQGEMSFWISPQYAGQGYVTEAAKAALDYGFTQLNLNRICAYHMARNPASGRILEKLGMTKEGHLRQRVIKWDKPEDVLLWAILKQDTL